MTAPILVWIRRDLRLHDHAALSAAAQSGRPVLPVFLCDEALEGLGTAAKWRFGAGVGAFAQSLEAIGSRLILRRRPCLEGLSDLIQETGADTVYWQRSYDPEQQARDAKVKAALRQRGVQVKSFAGHLLFEPWTVETKTGGPYKVYSPFWRAVKDRGVATPPPAIKELRAPGTWPASDDLERWNLGAAMRRGAPILAKHARVGESAALDRLNWFTQTAVESYKEQRDFPGVDASSALSEPLTYGEISPRTIWHAGQRALAEGAAGAEHFLKELVWREFAYHLLHHWPDLPRQTWRREWAGFNWNRAETPQVTAWKQGRTGIEFVDAAMREMYVTGRMHNRARMIVGSYLTKHLLADWRIGLDWFADCLTDWDPASNAMGWQWVAGCGPDAAPYFRVFNPVTQSDKFDADRSYRNRWIAEEQGAPPETALDYFKAVPKAWALDPGAPYPHPIVTAADGRDRALQAYGMFKDR
ncbi:Deoxyribodipyrimidine photolyase [Candidatus Rhodobacter oscarellae]|uniref:Deoxyribodipyrimidine photolyase n=1 Tax=Candidatus Rhodobacter oscarellae TaxID=1675527 RepID=A0A0J9GU49_9RHOB|nr:deoxyribodipyrimidine photo-lyase [Candidatus Rhodobacter lobularis]KMW57093.1 Deoxyribodipyrimidine photolyase [Candidatus Rhodobacter lobularis]